MSELLHIHVRDRKLTCLCVSYVFETKETTEAAHKNVSVFHVRCVRCNRYKELANGPDLWIVRPINL